MDQSDDEHLHAARADEDKRAWWPTNEFAAELDVKPQSVRKRYSQTGSFWGIKPITLPNGHLRWPRDPVKLLTKGDGK